MPTDDILYGKLKNNTLIVAPALVVRNRHIESDNAELYLSAGYKQVIYSPAPENETGYNLVATWHETDTYIKQKWEKVRLPFDQSDRLLCAIRDYISSMRYIMRSIIKHNEDNLKEMEQCINENLLFRLLYKNKELLPEGETLLSFLHKCDLNLCVYFEQLSIVEELRKNHIIVFPTHFTHEKYVDDESRYIPFTYVKSNLSHIASLSDFSTLESKTQYDMSYIYGFTLFDELLLLFIKYILRLENNWLIGNTSITFRDIVECSDIEDVKEAIIDKKVEELSWESCLDKIKFLRDRGIQSIVDNDGLFSEDILYIAEKRNVIVHNSGLWNYTSLSKLKGTKYDNPGLIGKPVEKTVSSILHEMQVLQNAAILVYNALCDKFKLLHRYEVKEDCPDDIDSKAKGCMI